MTLLPSNLRLKSPSNLFPSVAILEVIIPGPTTVPGHSLPYLAPTTLLSTKMALNILDNWPRGK